ALYRIRVSRHLADIREACGTAEPRLRALERPLRRHVPVEHQVAQGHGERERLLDEGGDRVGYLRRLQVGSRQGLDARRGLPALRVSIVERPQSEAEPPTA